MTSFLPDRQVLKDDTKVRQLQDSLIQTLGASLGDSHPLDSSLFPRVLLIISTLRELSIEYKRMLTSAEGKAELSDQLHSEFLEILGLV